MARRTFYVTAKWDPEARVYYSESGIKGLHIEAETLEAFEEIMTHCAEELIHANHPEAVPGRADTP